MNVNSFPRPEEQDLEWARDRVLAGGATDWKRVAEILLQELEWQEEEASFL